MTGLNIAIDNLLSPPILSFILGVVASIAQSDLRFPESMGKFLGIYLMFGLGLKGGSSIAHCTDIQNAMMLILVAVVLSFALPFIAKKFMDWTTSYDAATKIAVSAHYGSVSVVTFMIATHVLECSNISYESSFTAVTAAMEGPAIMAAILMMNLSKSTGSKGFKMGELLHHMFFNGAILVLMGAFIIGLFSSEDSLKSVSGFFATPFKGVLCLFLLDMGLLVGKKLRTTHTIEFGELFCALALPLVNASVGFIVGYLLNLTPGGIFLLMTLCASASYIAVPAAMRVAIPQANPGVYVTMALGITFPFNLLIGLPLYLWVIGQIVGF